MSAIAPAAIPAAPGGIIGFFQNLLTGFPLSGTLGYITLLFLTVFPVTGIAGLNLIAVGEPLTAFIKASSCVVSLLLMTFLSPYLPVFMQGNWMTWVSALGPWYIFDILQLVEYSDFNKNGFVSLLPILPSGGGKNSSWRLTITFLNLFLATIAASGQVLPAIFPDMSIFGVSTSTFGNSVSIVSASLFGITSLGSLAAVAFGPSIAPASVVAALVPKVGGGTATSLPPLSDMLETLSSSNPLVQTGGAVMPSDRIFLSVLGFVAVVGICMGFARSKQ
jgi:hypothetical protein